MIRISKHSTWKGKCVYLDDIVITESYRRKGIGKLLFDAVIQASCEMKARRLEWQVLDWNSPAIEFYKNYNAAFLKTWLNCRLTEGDLKKLNKK